MTETFAASGYMPEPWKGPAEPYGEEIRKEEICMTRIVAAHDNKKLYVGSDTLWMGVNGQPGFYAPKLVGNDKVIVAFLGIIRFVDRNFEETFNAEKIIKELLAKIPDNKDEKLALTLAKKTADFFRKLDSHASHNIQYIVFFEKAGVFQAHRIQVTNCYGNVSSIRVPNDPSKKSDKLRFACPPSFKAGEGLPDEYITCGIQKDPYSFVIESLKADINNPILETIGGEPFVLTLKK